MTTPVVIDIYQGNDIEDMSLLKNAGIIGIIHKTTQGTSVVDHRYDARRKWAKDAGIELWGAYHFNSETSSIAEQAKDFVLHAQADDYTLLAADWEGDSNQAWSAREAREWLSRVLDLTKRQPSGLWIYGGNIPRERITSSADMDFFGQFHNWHCQYPFTSHPNVSHAWKNGAELYQYSESGHLAGTGAAVDLNIYVPGDLAKLRADWAPGYAKDYKPSPKPTQLPPVVSEPINKAPSSPVDHRPPAPNEPNSWGRGFWDWFKSH